MIDLGVVGIPDQDDFFFNFDAFTLKKKKTVWVTFVASYYSRRDDDFPVSSLIKEKRFAMVPIATPLDQLSV